MKEYRRVPQSQLRKRLRIEEYDVDAPFEETDHRPALVRIKMKQHAGKPAAPVVATGRRVKKGQVIGRVEESALGADVHASIDGKVRAVNEEFIEIAG